MFKGQKKAPSVDYTSKLKIGIKGDILVDAGNYKGRYPSRVQDITDDLIGFDHPFLKEALLPAYRNMSFTFTMEDGGALYVFSLSVRRTDNKTGLPVMWAELIDYPTRIQRRQFLRVSCLWEASIFHLTQEERSPMSGKWMDVKVTDISIGGYLFKLHNDTADELDFQSNDKILLRFVLAGNTYFQFGRTSRIVYDKKTWEIGVGFESLSSSLEKKLFDYIRQQELMGREQI